MANNINQIKATIEANLAKIQAAYLTELATNPTAEGVATARANYAAALISAQLNANALIENQLPFEDIEWAAYLVEQNAIQFRSLTGSSGGTGAPPNLPQNQCLEWFKEYLAHHKLLLKLMYDNFSVFGGGKINQFLDIILGKEGRDNIIDCWLACEWGEYYKNIRPGESTYQKGAFESCFDYVRRMQKTPRRDGDPTPEFDFKLPERPDPNTPPFDPERYLNNPFLIGDLDKQIQKYLKQLEEEGVPGVSANCADVRKQAMAWLAERLHLLHSIADLLLRMEELYKKIQKNCDLTLERFEARRIGKFRSLDEFFQYLKWFWFESFPWNAPDYTEPTIPEIYGTTPNASLSDAMFEHNKYGFYRDRPERVEESRKKYQEWLNTSVEVRSEYPPVKDMFPALDKTDFTDKDILMLLVNGMIKNGYRGEGQENILSMMKTIYIDFCREALRVNAPNIDTTPPDGVAEI